MKTVTLRASQNNKNPRFDANILGKKIAILFKIPKFHKTCFRYVVFLIGGYILCIYIRTIFNQLFFCQFESIKRKLNIIRKIELINGYICFYRSYNLVNNLLQVKPCVTGRSFTIDNFSKVIFQIGEPAFANSE